MPPVLSKYWKDTPRFNVLVLGDIHEGKSQLVDAMLDPAVDQPRPDILELGNKGNADGTTKGCITYVGKVINGRRIMISDVPGVSDGTAFLQYEGDDNAADDAESRTAAGAGGLIALLQDRFRKGSINLVLIVHPSDKTPVQLGGTLLNALIKLGLVAGAEEDVSKNIKVVFTKADILDAMPDEDDRQIQREQLVDKVLPKYFAGLGDSVRGTGAVEDEHCFTYGVPWNDGATLEEKKQRPKMKTVKTHELDALISQVIRARPEFAYDLKLPPGAAEVLRDLGLAQIFGSKASIESYFKGHKAQTAELLWRRKNGLAQNGAWNCHEELRHIVIHLKTETGAWADELRTREKFLRKRTQKKGKGPSSLRGLEDEFIVRGHIGPRPAPGESYPHRQGFPYLCPPNGRKGDIAWALYEKATVAMDGFDGSKRVPFVADEDAPDEDAPAAAARTTPGSAGGPSSLASGPGSSRGGRSTPARPRPPHAREQPIRGGKANAGAAERASPAGSPPPPPPPEPEPVPVEVLRKRPYRNLGHQFLCKIEDGDEKWLPAKLLEVRYPQLVAAFNAAAAEEEEDPRAAVSSTASASEEGEAAEADQPARPPERDPFAFGEEAARGPAKKKPRSPAWVSQR